MRALTVRQVQRIAAELDRKGYIDSLSIHLSEVVKGGASHGVIEVTNGCDNSSFKVTPMGKVIQ